MEKLHYSKNREKILDLIKQANHPVCAEEIYNLLESKNINLSTVYRSLKYFEENGLINKSIRNDKKAYYTINKKENEHYVVCKKCNKIIELKTCPLDLLYKNNIIEEGFEITKHVLEIEGICSKCKK